MATTAPLPHFTAGDELWVDHIFLFWGVSLRQMRHDSAGTQPPDSKNVRAVFYVQPTCFPKLLCNYICSISSQSFSIRGRRLLWYRVITLTEQSNCNVNAGTMVGRARVKAQAQIRLALIKQRRLTRWQPNLAHEGPRRLPTPFLRHSGPESERTHDSRSRADHRRAEQTIQPKV